MIKDAKYTMLKTIEHAYDSMVFYFHLTSLLSKSYIDNDKFTWQKELTYMQKEELLRKYRNEQQDEGKDHVNHSADTNAFYGMLVFAVLIMVYQVYTDAPFGDVPAMLYCFLAIGSFSRYRITKEKYHLYMTILNAAICITFIVGYILQT